VVLEVNNILFAIVAALFHFQLVNDSGHLFSKLWIRPHTAKSWGSEYLHGKPLGVGEAIEIFGNGSGDWDLRVQYDKRNYEVFTDLDLSKYKQVTIQIIDGKWDAHYEEN
jgi:hypothetical protein